MMLPPVDLQGGPLLALARDASVTALMSVFGTIAFRTLVAPRAFAHMAPDLVVALKRRLLVLAQTGIGAGILGTFAWLDVQAAYMADAGTVGETFAAIPTVVEKTAFGHVIALQFLALLVLATVLGWRDRGLLQQRIALGAGIVTVALQAGHSHAESMYAGPSVLLAVDVVHLLGAGAWLGGLVPLLLVVRAAPPAAGASAARWFSPLGQWCIAALAASAIFQAWVLVASIPGLVGTAYGWMVMVKTVLFAVLCGFAWFNRYRFAPALLHDHPEAARRVFLRSIFLQTGFGLAIIAAAIVLSELPPAMHLQPLWPFRQRLSFAAISEDPDFLHEVLEAALALAGALAAVIVAFLLRKFRIAALALAAVVAWLALPHFDLLLASAYPTSFYHSPTGFSSETIVEGAALYARNCVSCHGADGTGNGPLAKSLPVPPADLTAAHLWMHSDGELFWWLAAGIRTPEGAQAMPGFAGTLDEDERWALIDYIRAHNAGHAFAQTGIWPQPVQAPSLAARCGTRTLQLSDLSGRIVRLVIGTAPASGDDAVTIVTGAGIGGDCVARDESVTEAYAIISGVTVDAVQGTQFLIDGEGWLRAAQQAGSTASWNDPKVLAAEIMSLHAHPVAAAAGASEKMKMPM